MSAESREGIAACRSAAPSRFTAGSAAGTPGSRLRCRPSNLAVRVVVVPVRRLQQVERNAARKAAARAEEGASEEPSYDRWTDDEDQEQEEHEEVEDGVADDTALAKLGLLERVDWWADLAAVVIR